MMNKKQWFGIASSLVLSLCLCTQEGDTNPAGGSGGDATVDYTGKWEMVSMVSKNYDADGNEIANDHPMDISVAFLLLEATSFTMYMPTDTCLTTDGPNDYTLSGNTMTYMWMGMLEITQDLELKDGNLIMTMEMETKDQTTGAVLSKMVTVSTFKPYSGTLPQSSWPATACPAMF